LIISIIEISKDADIQELTIKGARQRSRIKGLLAGWIQCHFVKFAFT
jgi:hypothetical protein